jgi:hypothetical protein
MRSVGDTDTNPECVLSAIGHSTEWISTNDRLSGVRPNHSSASGSSAIAGSGLNMAVSVSRNSAPMRVMVANVVRSAAIATPALYPTSRILIDTHTLGSSSPLTIASTNALTVALNVGTSSWLLSQRP